MKRRRWSKVTVQHYRGEVAVETEIYVVCDRPAATGVAHIDGRPALYLRPLVQGEGDEA